MLHERSSLSLFRQYTSHEIEERWRRDEVPEAHRRERRGDEIRKIAARLGDRRDGADDRLASGCLDRLFEVMSETAVSLAGGLRRHLERHGVERVVVSGGVTAH